MTAASRGETDLARLLAGMRPALQAGSYRFCTLPTGVAPAGLAALATFRESEGLTVVVDGESAVHCGLEEGPAFAWIALTVHSDLAAVGFLAAVASALAAAGIPCNAIAGFYHDHLFVPEERAPLALATLERLARGESEAIAARTV